jgi:hypothetical protein
VHCCQVTAEQMIFGTAESRTAGLSSADVDRYTLGMDLPNNLFRRRRGACPTLLSVTEGMHDMILMRSGT